MTDLDRQMMEMALDEARAASTAEEVPIGAVLVDADGIVLARTHNLVVTDKDPTAHAELLAIRQAATKLGNERLMGTTLYVTLEPCAMCAGAIAMARVARVVYAAPDPKGGAIAHGPRFFEQPTCHHRPVVEDGLYAEEAGQMLKDFFRARRS